MTGMSRSSHGRPGSVALASSEGLRGNHLREVSSLPGGVALGGGGGGGDATLLGLPGCSAEAEAVPPEKSLMVGTVHPSSRETEAGRGD